MNNLLFLADPATTENFDLMEFLTGPSILEALKALGLAILVWIIGSFVIGKVMNVLQKYFTKIKMDESLRPFLISIIGVLMKIMLLLAAVSTLGMDVMSFVAIFSAAAFAVGLALQGGLSNFAGGVMILLFKPFKIGDVISAQGFTGKVKEIQIFNTILLTPDSRTIMIPNGPLSNGPIENVTMAGIRRVDMTFGIGYGDDIEKAKTVIMEVVKSCPLIPKPEETAIVVSELAGSSVNFGVMPHCAAADFLGVKAYMNEHIKKAFDRENIGIPYETMDINIVSQP